LQTALQDLRTFIDEFGPFDAVLGFSQGASLAASFIAHYGQDCASGSNSDFRCAIFICGINGLHSRGGGRVLNVVEDGEIIQIPTVHILGSKDPYMQESLGLTRICDHRTRVVLDHKGGHEGPRGNAVVSEMASCISKALETAALVQ
jgi:predicted esterase